MRRLFRRNGSPGFTLIEVIVSLVVAAMLGAAFFQLMGTGIRQSSEPVLMVQRAGSLSEVMDKITADYRDLIADSGISTPLETLKTRIGGEGSKQEDNLYCSDTPGGLQRYYTVKHNRYIKFTSGAEVAENTEKQVLKVTIATRAREGVPMEQLTALFTR